MNAIPHEIILKLVEAGIQAPSADNGQPWKFKLLGDGFELWLDGEHMGLFFDVKQVATIISCGALIENVVIMAKALGLKTQIHYFGENVDITKDPHQFARLTFTSEGRLTNADKTVRMIYNRHTNRNLFQFNKKIPESLLAELIELVQADEKYHLHAYQTPKDKKTIIQLVTATDTIRFIHEQIHNDFFKVLRFGKSARQTRDGLASATLGIESVMIPILRLLRPWRLTQLLNLFGLHRVMAFRGTWLPMKSASLIVAITSNGTADYVEWGRVIERFWLQANNAGLSVQPLGALPLFLARLKLTQGEGFNSEQIKTISALGEDFAKLTPGFNKDCDQVVMLFRLGYEKKQATRPYRRPTESFFL